MGRWPGGFDGVAGLGRVDRGLKITAGTHVDCGRAGTAATPIRLALPRLDGPAASALVAAIAGRHQLAARLGSEILARSDGIPLYIEEMTKAVIETARAGEAVSVPPSLRDSHPLASEIPESTYSLPVAGSPTSRR